MIKLKLHLGCGKRYLGESWTHVDLLPYDHVDVKADVCDLHMFDDGSVTEIYACHVLEHIQRQKMLQVLSEWNRVLMIGGCLRLAVPDWEAVVDYYQSTKTTQTSRLWEIIGLITGGQRDQWDHHTFVFDEPLLRSLLQHSGFDNIQRYEWQNFLPPNFDDYSRCYLPHMDVTNGKLMSLNVLAYKTEEAGTHKASDDILMATKSQTVSA